MRTRTRIHPYVLPEISHRLAAYCGAKGLTESAAVEAALSAYLDGGEKDNDLVLRRLDRLARDSARQRRDQEVLLESFAMYVRHWFKYVPERSQAEDLAAQRLALKRFDEFVHWTSLAMARGTRLVSDVLKDEAPPEQPSPKAGQPPHGPPMIRDSWSDRDSPFFRPRMGRGRRGVEPATGMTMKRAVLQRLARALGSGRRVSDRPSGHKGRARCDVRLPPGARRCVVKASYVRLAGGGAKAETVRRIFASFVAGKSPRAIADELNHAGVSAPHDGGKGQKGVRGWGHTTVRSMLSNARYTGQVTWNTHNGCASPEGAPGGDDRPKVMPIPP